MYPALPINLRNSGTPVLQENNHTKIISIERTARKHDARSNYQDCASSRRVNTELISTKRAVPLIDSRSLGNPHERIQRERRAHTMAPLTRISGPSSMPKANLFASIPAPVQAQSFRPEFSYGQSDIELTDDETPVVVKVRYDPRAGVLPSEEAVRKAIGHQIFDRKKRKEPIIVDFSGQKQQFQLSKPLPNRVTLQPSSTLPSVSSHPPLSFLRHTKSFSREAPKPALNREIPRLPTRNKISARVNRVDRKGLNNSKLIYHEMASQNNQQILSNRPNIPRSSGEVFRPPPVNDIPELSRENLLNMLNQIPDLQGRRFNIEYAPPTAPEGYPIPSNLDFANNAYPEPVVIDRLPTNVIQHVKSSNNPALTAALEATIQQEQQHLHSQPPTVVHHPAQPYQQVQQSRPVSSNDSESSTEVSSSESSSSEETDREEETEPVPTPQLGNRIPLVGPMPPTFYSHS